jgi:hypothetical protein
MTVVSEPFVLENASVLLRDSEDVSAIELLLQKDA